MARLRAEGHTVYDFKNPMGDGPGTGFAWQSIDPNWRTWTPQQYLLALTHAKAQTGFESDERAMIRADACVLVLPAGRSAHVEFGWMLGRGQLGYVLLSEDGFEPDLMYLLTPHSRLCTDLGELVQKIKDDAGLYGRAAAIQARQIGKTECVETFRSSSRRPNFANPPATAAADVSYAGVLAARGSWASSSPNANPDNIPKLTGSAATPPVMPHVVPTPRADVANEIAIDGGVCNLAAPPPAFAVLEKLKGAVGGPEVGDEYSVRSSGGRELFRGTAEQCRLSLAADGYEPATAEVVARVSRTLHAGPDAEVWANPAEIKRLDEWFEALRQYFP